MQKLRSKFRNSSSLEKFIDKSGGVVTAAHKLGVDRKTLYNFRVEMDLI